MKKNMGKQTNSEDVYNIPPAISAFWLATVDVKAIIQLNQFPIVTRSGED